MLFALLGDDLKFFVKRKFIKECFHHRFHQTLHVLRKNCVEQWRKVAKNSGWCSSHDFGNTLANKSKRWSSVRSFTNLKNCTTRNVVREQPHLFFLFFQQ